MLINICDKILRSSINTITVKVRFFNTALNKLGFDLYDGTIATDGKNIICNPQYIVDLYKKGDNEVTRAFLHVIIHCLFRAWDFGNKLDIKRWDLACDITVENIIIELQISSFELENDNKKSNFINRLNLKKLIPSYIYQELQQYEDFDIDELIELFKVDDHSIWYQQNNASNNSGVQGDSDSQGDSDGQGNSDSQGNYDGQGDSDSQGYVDNQSNNSSQKNKNTQADQKFRKDLDKEWENIAKKIEVDMETFSKEMGDRAGSFRQNLHELNREKYDYSEFLKKFAVLNERMKTNEDEFDYIFYTYGFKMFGKIPLIEPLEYKDEKLVKEFVIAIDTSGSTSGEMVQNFLQKTYNILLQEESFAKKINIHIIQCDADVQEDFKITNKEEFNKYIKTCSIKGGGGTDFTPVFLHVQRLIEKREFNNLKGLIYFTDGYGTFPTKKPDYDTAFAFLEEDENIIVPPWAYSIILEKENF